jgi:hypothetical protein
MTYRNTLQTTNNDKGRNMPQRGVQRNIQQQHIQQQQQQQHLKQQPQRQRHLSTSSTASQVKKRPIKP